jgi:hypothetical protein
MPLDLTPDHLAVLERVAARGFSIVAFPLYASAVGIRKGNCATLLRPGIGTQFTFFGAPCYLIEGNLSVRCTRQGRDLFVWKKKELAVTAEHLAELADFRRELEKLLILE